MSVTNIISDWLKLINRNNSVGDKHTDVDIDGVTHRFKNLEIIVDQNDDNDSTNITMTFKADSIEYPD